MSRSFALLSASVALLAAACGGDPKPAATPAPEMSASAMPTVTAAPSASTAPSVEPKVEKPVEPEPTKAAVTFTGPFATPESVLYDAANDRYLVSNINGMPGAVDNNGFISELTPDGKIKAEKWIEGGKNKVTLDAPKGMAIVKGVLYVADISTVRMFDAKTGAPKGEVKLEGATFANDVAASADGKIYVSDSGIKISEKGIDPTKTDAVWVIEKGKAKAFAKGEELGHPNGLLVEGKNVVVVTFGSGELYKLDEKGTKTGAVKFPKGSLDGIVSVGGKFFVSSWEGASVFASDGVGAGATAVIVGTKTPADIGFDSKRNRILVPNFNGNAVQAFDVK
jgi:hypothetical protein